jgi:transcriptional regulator of met regulon
MSAKQVTVSLPSEVFSLIADEARRRGMRFDELAGMKLASAVLAENELERLSRRNAAVEKARENLERLKAKHLRG